MKLKKKAPPPSCQHTQRADAAGPRRVASGREGAEVRRPAVRGVVCTSSKTPRARLRLGPCHISGDILSMCLWAEFWRQRCVVEQGPCGQSSTPSSSITSWGPGRSRDSRGFVWHLRMGAATGPTCRVVGAERTDACQVLRHLPLRHLHPKCYC